MQVSEASLTHHLKINKDGECATERRYGATAVTRGRLWTACKAVGCTAATLMHQQKPTQKVKKNLKPQHQHRGRKGFRTLLTSSCYHCEGKKPDK